MPGLPFQTLPNAQQNQPAVAPQQGALAGAAGQFSHIPPMQQMQGPSQMQPQAQPQTPDVVLTENFKRQLTLIQGREQNILSMRLPPEQHDKAIQDLQKEIDELAADYSTKQTNIANTAALIEQGGLDPEQGMMAMWQQVLPAEASRAMYRQWKLSQEASDVNPRNLPFGSITPQARNDKMAPSKLEEFMGGYIDPLVGPKPRAQAVKEAVGRHPGRVERILPFWWNLAFPGEQAADSDTWMRQYARMRDEVGYDSYTPESQRQFDSTWDHMVKNAGVGDDKWNPNSPGVQALRAKGPLARSFTRGLTESGGPLASDIAGSLQQIAQRRAKVEEESKKPLTEEALKALMIEANDDPDLAEELARRRGYTW